MVKDAGKGDGSKQLTCTNKFGEVVTVPAHQQPLSKKDASAVSSRAAAIDESVAAGLADSGVSSFKATVIGQVSDWDYASLRHFCSVLVARAAKTDTDKDKAIEVLTALNDRHYPTGEKKRSAVLHIVRQSLAKIFSSSPKMGQSGSGRYRYIDRELQPALAAPDSPDQVLVLNAREFEPEGDDCDARLIVKAYQKGWKNFICYGYKGQRFTGCGLSNDTEGVRIDVYDSSGDYLASGIDGLQIHVHGNAQDQLGQIMKRGKLVIHGDVGQTFMYGAKGGEVYVLGNAAGRPLINAVGRPRVVINGTCLDYLAQSFMAGDPLNGGGFIILNGIEFDEDANIIDQPTPYPGSNLFSLASGGAIYLLSLIHI